MTKEEAKTYLSQLSAEDFFAKLNSVKTKVINQQSPKVEERKFVVALYEFLEGKVDLYNALNTDANTKSKEWVNRNKHKSDFLSGAIAFFLAGTIDLCILGTAMEAIETPQTDLQKVAVLKAKKEAKTYLSQLSTEEFFEMLSSLKADTTSQEICVKEDEFVKALYHFLEQRDVSFTRELNLEVIPATQKWIDDNAYRLDFPSDAKRYFLDEQISLCALGKVIERLKTKEEAKAYLSQLSTEEFYEKLNSLKTGVISPENANDDEFRFMVALCEFLEPKVDLIVELNSEAYPEAQKWIDSYPLISNLKAHAKKDFQNGFPYLSTLGKVMEVKRKFELSELTTNELHKLLLKLKILASKKEKNNTHPIIRTLFGTSPSKAILLWVFRLLFYSPIIATRLIESGVEHEILDRIWEYIAFFNDTVMGIEIKYLWLFLGACMLLLRVIYCMRKYKYHKRMMAKYIAEMDELETGEFEITRYIDVLIREFKALHDELLSIEYHRRSVDSPISPLDSMLCYMKTNKDLSWQGCINLYRAEKGSEKRKRDEEIAKQKAEWERRAAIAKAEREEKEKADAIVQTALNKANNHYGTSFTVLNFKGYGGSCFCGNTPRIYVREASSIKLARLFGANILGDTYERLWACPKCGRYSMY